MDLCNRLKEIRLQKGLTQESLGQTVGVTRQTIIAIEKGKFRPSVELALKLAVELNTPLQGIFWLGNNRGETS